MSLSSIKRLPHLAKQFRTDARGNVAIIFALVSIPLVALVGAAVDYTRAAADRTALQSALDSAALMISKDAATMSDSAAITTRARQYVDSLYTASTDTPIQSFTATYTPNTGNGATIQLDAGGTMPTYFMRVMGSQFDTLPIKTSSTTTWGNTRLRIALALDVTGSMADAGKLGAMQTAAKKLIDTLKTAAQGKEDVYLSVIPFNVMVNVGSSNKTASWLDWDTSYGSCSKSTYKQKSSCVAAGKTWTPNNVSSWKGCVEDRVQDEDTTKNAPTTSDSDTLYLAQNYSACPASILQMTSVYTATEPDNSTDTTTIKGKINSLKANGATNQAIGMQMSWMMLQPTDPFVTPSKDANYKYTDAIILLSDGMNTQDRWYGNGSSWSSQVDARQQKLCDNIKTAKTTTIYTIQVNTDGDPESAVLKYCADSGQFYSSTTASGIATAFSSIGASLLKLRIAK
jgi:Flp pilus assembly protein TadG